MLLPVQFLKFWFIDSPKNLIEFFTSFNNAFIQITSLSLLLKTFFKPWKNEYREGLVGFSIVMGIFMKSMIIVADLVLFLIVLVLEFIAYFAYLLLPLFSILSVIYLQTSRLLFFPASVILIGYIFFSFRPKKSFSEIASGKSVVEVIKYLLKQKEIEFFLRKLDIKKEEIALIEVPKNTTINDGVEFFVDYLFATEEKTKLLFNKEFKREDLENIIYWTKSTFAGEGRPFRINFSGEGFVDSWTYGWTLETRKYMVDMTSEILNKKPLLFGRESEYKQLLNALSARKSVVLVGEPGSGKNTLVEALCYESFSSDLKDFHHQRIFKLYLDTLLAGAGNQGEIEKRLGEIIAEISHSGNVVIYVSDFENILGSSSFKIDLSGVFIPYLKSKSIRIIGAVTEGAYKRFVERMVSVADVFEIIKIEEPGKNTLLKMLMDKASAIEKKMGVDLSYKAILASLNLANKYLVDRTLPGAGVVLLEDAANEVRLSGRKEVLEADVIKRAEEKTKINLSAPGEDEKKLLVNLEERMHETLVDQEEAVKSIAEGIRRIRSGLKIGSKPISFLFLGPTGVGKTQTAKSLANLYFGGEKNMLRFDMSEYPSDTGLERFVGCCIGPESEGIAGKVHESPSSLILLDEFEKANSAIHNLFLQILDDGRLTDMSGKTVFFANTIIVATSNAGSEFIRQEIEKGVVVDKNFKDKFLGYLLSENLFRPELLNRFDDIVVFTPLGEKEVGQIVNLLLKDVKKNLSEKDIELNVDEKVVFKIAKEGFDEQFGARPLKRFIQDNIEDLIAKKILNNEIKRGDKVNVSVNDANILAIATNHE